MKKNIPLLKKTLRLIEQYPHLYDQADFRCGSTACYAGHAALLAGGRWQNPQDGMDATLEANPEKGWPQETAYMRGKRVLGLNDVQAGRLFYESSNLKELKKAVAELCRKR